MTPFLHLEKYGSGPPLVLLHGWGWHSGIWNSLIPDLEKDFQLFMIDLPGFGKSPVFTDDYTLENIAQHLFEIVPDQAIWLGWSLGGMLAWWIALHHPKKVSRLITVCSSPRFVQDENWPGVPLTTLENFSDKLVHHYEQTLTDFLELQCRGAHTSPKLLTELKNIMLTTTHPSLGGLLGGLELLKNIDLRQDMQQLTIPSLHLFGSHDTLVFSRVAKLIQPLQTEVIPRCGHMPFITHRERFIELIKRPQK